MDKKKGLIIGGSIGAAALIALVVTSIAVANRPSALIVRAFANTISDAKKLEVFDVADDVINGGSISVSADLDKVLKNDLAAQGKIYLDAKDMKSAYELTLKDDDEVVFQPRILCNSDRMAMTCPELFDGSYGVNIKNLEKNLPGSIFDPDEETDYSLTDEQYDYFMNLRDTVKNDKNLQRDMSNMNTKYRTRAIELLVKYSDVGTSSKTITVGDEKIPCTAVTLTIDEEALAQAGADLIEYANNDKDLEKFLYRIASNGSLREEPDDYVDRFYDYLDDIEDELEEIDDLELQLVFYVTKSGRRLAQFEAELEYGKDDYELTLALGKNVTKSKEMSLAGEDKRTGEGFSITYSVETNTSSAYEAVIKTTETQLRRVYVDYGDNRDYDQELETTGNALKIEWDRRAGDFSIRYKDKYSDYSVKGNLIQKGDKYIFLLTNLRGDGEAVTGVKTLELTITIDRHDPMPNVPGNFTDVTKMDKREFKHLVEDIVEGVGELKDEYFGK